jgi:2,3-bisphosphoglycerate-dependent phosphoglycerate mutase
MKIPGREYRIVFIRHGHSDWNIGNRFTGWTDIDLNPAGIGQATAAGRRLADTGILCDEAHVSVLRRTRQTAEAMIEAAGWGDIPIHETWRLNERHYGALQGMNKQEIFAHWGEEKSRRWWRGYREPPPALAPEDPRHPRHDPRYAGLDPALLPATESLCDCQQRMLPYWNEVLLPSLVAGRCLLVVSHGNTLRGLVMHLENISAEDMEHVEIPSGVPLVYRLSPALQVIAREWLQ